MNRRPKFRSHFYQSAAAHLLVCLAIALAMQGPSSHFKKGAPGHTTSQMLFIETPPLVPQIPVATQTTQLKTPTPAPVVAKTPVVKPKLAVMPTPKKVHTARSTADCR